MRRNAVVLALVLSSVLASAQVYTPPVSDAPYGAGWNGDKWRAPSRNSVFDVISTLTPGGDPNIVAIAGINPAAGDMFYWTAPGAVTKFATTLYGRSLLGHADANDLRPDLRLGYINAMDAPYYAKGDNSADDSTAIQAAIDDAATDGVGWVYLPPGRYCLDSALVPRAGVSVAGVPYRTYLKVRTAGGAAFDLTGLGKNIERWHLYGLVFYANQDGCYGIKGDLSWYIAWSTFEKLEFYRELAVDVQGVLGGVTFRDCRFGAGGTLRTTHQHVNAVAAGTKATFTTSFEHCYFCGADGVTAGVDVDFANTLVFRSCVFEFGDSVTVRLKGVRMARFDGCNWEGCAVGTNAITLAQNATPEGANAYIVSGRITNNGPWTHFADVGSACLIGVEQALITAGSRPIVVGTGINENRLRIRRWSANTVVGYGAGTELNGMPESPSRNDLVVPSAIAVTSDTALGDMRNESGRWYTNDGASGTVKITLPSAASYTGILKFSNVETAVGAVLEVRPYGSERIRPGLNGDSLRLMPGATVTLQSIEASRWEAVASHGTIGLEDAGYVSLSESMASHDYGATATAWTMTQDEAAATLFVVTNASGPADAVLPNARLGHHFSVYNNSGQTITFKVSGQAGSAVATGKRALFVLDATDCREIYEQP